MRRPAGDPVHGMAGELVHGDWPPLTDPEVRSVLAQYPSAAAPAATAAVVWRSPRPFSAAALVQVGERRLFVKRHHRRVRSPGRLAVEHDFADHLRGRDVPVPRVVRRPGGPGGWAAGRWVYEVHEAAAGIDTYRDAASWTPYRSPGQARSAGAALARLHLAATDFAAPERPWGPLMSSSAILRSADPLVAIERLADERPGLSDYLAGRAWRRELGRHLVPALRRAHGPATGLPAHWSHGDWHPSNLSWSSADADATVAGVFDLGTANRTSAVHDLATALERSAVGWLALAATGRAPVDLPGATALLAGYRAVRPLSAAEAAALPLLLPVVHVEFALSELEYFHAVTASAANADLAYHGYLLGHAEWFATPAGAALLAAFGGR